MHTKHMHYPNKPFFNSYKLYLMFYLKYTLDRGNNSSCITNVCAFTCFFLFFLVWIGFVLMQFHLFLQLLKLCNFVPADNTPTHTHTLSLSLTDNERWSTGRNNMTSFRPSFKETHHTLHIRTCSSCPQRRSSRPVSAP